ncbi:MAG: hypothetical protein R3213_01960 [Flavobacteriaceae bacterium]|nr:hypothetical protein [Flavobacteriaceae bacterium]
MKTLVCVIILIFANGCATHNIKRSERACRSGVLATYADDDFTMSCQKIEKIIYEGNTPRQVVVREFAPKEDTSNWGPGTYGKEIISKVKK